MDFPVSANTYQSYGYYNNLLSDRSSNMFSLSTESHSYCIEHCTSANTNHVEDVEVEGARLREKDEFDGSFGDTYTEGEDLWYFDSDYRTESEIDRIIDSRTTVGDEDKRKIAQEIRDSHKKDLIPPSEEDINHEIEAAIERERQDLVDEEVKDVTSGTVYNNGRLMRYVHCHNNDNEKYDINVTNYPNPGDHCVNFANITDTWEISNINLGLVEREQPDLALRSDLDNVRVITDGREYTYLYGKRGIASTVPADYRVSFSKKYTEVYSRPVNPSDIAAVNDGTGQHKTEVYVTYKTYVVNNSSTLPVKILELINYYDANYTINTVNSPGWTDSSSDTGAQANVPAKYKVAYYTFAQEQIINPNNMSSPISIEFKVNDNMVQQLMTSDVLLDNISEIGVYSTLYGAETIVSEARLAKNAGLTERQYSGIDINSEPGNVFKYSSNPNDTFEDDTDMAPTFKLTKAEYKTLSGTVFEDSATRASLNNNERLGDGRLGKNEVTGNDEVRISNVKVELINQSTGQVAELLGIDNNGGVQRTPAVTYTDSNGHFTFGSNSTRYGVVTDNDNYVIRFTYGNSSSPVTTMNGAEINARNYKSTIITDSWIKSIMNGTVVNNEWYLSSQMNPANRSSVAIDDISQRTAIDNNVLKNSNFDDKYTMVAYTQPFAVHVEYTEPHEADVDSNGNRVVGGKFATDYDVFNLGIIERPRENLVVDKRVENLKITQSDGQVLTEGNPFKDKMSYVKVYGEKNVIKNATQSLRASQKTVFVEVNPEIIQSAKLDILYSITVTNNSEKDYEYGTNQKYYYYGDSSGLPLMQQTVELVADYVDPELTFEVGANGDWQQSSAEQLHNDGYITDNAYNALKRDGYTVFTTTAFNNVVTGQSRTQQLFASKLLANQEDEYTYENHAEILAVNGKIAKTIAESNNGAQVPKAYKPGNYEPSTLEKTSNPSDPNISHKRLHEQDDDDVIIRITPETGSIDNTIIYVITVLVTLIVLGGGIFIIKKKVLKR